MSDVCKLLILLFVLRAQHSLCVLPLHGACDKKRSRSSYLWRVDVEPAIYLFGTMHVPYTLVWEHISPVVKRAFYAAEEVYFELDLTDPETVSRLTTCQILPDEGRLSDLLPADLYRRLQRYLSYVRRALPFWLPDLHTQRDLYAEFLFNSVTYNWQRKRPIWVMLLINSLTPEEIQQRGVPVLDVFLQQEAHRRNKPSGAMETVREQCDSLNQLNDKHAIFALNLTLSYHESRAIDRRLFSKNPRWRDRQSKKWSAMVAAQNSAERLRGQQLVRSYNCGELSSQLTESVMQIKEKLSRLKLSNGSLEMAATIDAYFRREIILRRNKRMTDRIARLAKNSNGLWDGKRGAIFVALGAGHLLGGNSSVVQQLRKRGFLVKTVPRDDYIPSRFSSHPYFPSQEDFYEYFRRRKTPRPLNKHFRDLWNKVDENEDKQVNSDSQGDESRNVSQPRKSVSRSLPSIELHFTWIIITFLQFAVSV